MNIHIKLIFFFIFFHNIYGTMILNNGTKIVNDNGKANDWFGASVAMNNDYLVVGSPGDDDNGKTDIGSTSVYTVNENGFKLKGKLVPNDGQSGDEFGISVRINNKNYIVIGSDGHNTKRGCAYIYHHDGNQWTNQTIIADDGAEYDFFGFSVDINDNNDVVVGAYGDDDKGIYSGSVYVFKYNNNTWTQTQKLLPKDLSAYDYFGWAVSIGNVYLTVGAFNEDGGSGSVDVYKQNNNNQWEEQMKLTSPNNQAGGGFGYSINVHDKRVVIGAWNEDAIKGKVYVYATDGISWELEGTLQASDRKTGDRFGSSVDMNNNNIVIGAHRSVNNAKDSGSVYVYQLVDGTWQEIFKLVAADGEAGDYFGRSITVFNNKVVVGSYRNDAKGSESGAAYIFSDLPFATKLSTKSPTTFKHFSTNSQTISKNFTIQCDEEYMMGIWNRKQFTGKGNLTISLNNPTCNQYHQNLTHLWIVTNLTNCGTVTIETDSKIIKQNTATVTLRRTIGNLIERGSFFKYNIRCEFERRKNVSSSNSFDSTFVQQLIGDTRLYKSEVAHLSVNIAIYTNNLFNEIAPNPITVTANAPIYIGIVEGRQNKLLKFVVETCFATPSSNVNGIPYVFFHQKCRLDNSFAIIESNTDNFKFKIDAFKYIQLSKSIHIHCQLYICSSSATSEECQQSCRKRTRRAISDEAPLKAITLVSNEITFHKTINCNDLNCPAYSSCVKTYPAICRCNEGHVFNPTTNACENKNVFRINGLHLDTEFVPPYLDSTSSIFINFARKIEKQLNYFHIELREGTILGVQVIRARKGSVIVDLAVVYAKHSNMEDAFKTFVKSINNNYTKTLNYPNEIKIKYDITPTIAIPTALGNSTLSIVLIATLIIIAISLVVIILIKTINCKRSQKKEKQWRKEATMALVG